MSETQPGHAPCNECDVFTFVFSAEAVKRLPPGYTGELCPRCGLWVCRIDKLADHDETKD